MKGTFRKLPETCFHNHFMPSEEFLVALPLPRIYVGLTLYFNPHSRYFFESIPLSLNMHLFTCYSLKSNTVLSTVSL